MPGQNRDKIYSKCRFLENYMADSQTINLRENEKSNPSLSANHKEKGDKFYLIAFFYCGLQRPAAGGEGCRAQRKKSVVLQFGYDRHKAGGASP